jgi:hypothetical protein
MNVGIYYMANACGTILSGLLYQIGVRSSTNSGLIWCLLASATRPAGSQSSAIRDGMTR